MRVIKPFSASVITRAFELRGKQYLAVSVLLFSRMGEKTVLLPEKDLWPFWAAQPEAQAPLEEGFPRRHGEYIVCGSAWTTEQRRDAVAVRAAVGGLRKELVVWGPRAWQGATPSPAQPFESMRLAWTESYGGADHAANPVGIGRAEVEVAGRRLHPLARIEYPTRPLRSPREEGLPAGFGPIDMMWAQRAAFRGTYDERWLKEQYPGLASDFDWRLFNVAPLDQQQDRAFVGDEPYAFHNLHAKRPVIQGRLPGLMTRVFVERVSEDQLRLEEVRTQLTSLWFFPGEERLIQVFQGALEVAEDDASDIRLVMAAIEHLGQNRPAEHYRAVRDKRRDKKDGALETLRESDLVPADVAAALHDFTPSRNRGLERAQRRAELDRQAARDEVGAHQLDVDEHAPPVKGPPPPEIRSIDDIFEQRKLMEQEAADLPARMAREKHQAMADARTALTGSDQDFKVIEAEVAGQLTKGPPKAFAPALVSDFSDLITRGQAGGGDIHELQEMLADPKIMAQWTDGDTAQLKAYRETAQHQVPAARRSEAESSALALRLREVHGRGESLAGWDLTGAALSGLNLSGADLREALLECALLKGCNLRGAKLNGACLVRARIDSCLLDDACLAGANLSASEIDNTSLKAADLRDAILEETRFEKVDLSGARLDQIRLKGVQFSNVDLSGARCESMLLLHGLKLTSTRFKNADFKQATIVECDLSGVDLRGIQFGKVAFVGTRADRARMAGMSIGAGCFVMGSSLVQADLRGALMEKVCLRGTPMAGADLSGARLRSSDFSECDLRGAQFHGADARGALFVRAHLETAQLASANLAGAVLQHAWLKDTDFRHANLHEGDLARVRLGTGVQFQGALTSRMRTLPRRPMPANPA